VDWDHVAARGGKSSPQALKRGQIFKVGGTTEVVPFPKTLRVTSSSQGDKALVGNIQQRLKARSYDASYGAPEGAP
jgi:hypothetical protein